MTGTLKAAEAAGVANVGLAMRDGIVFKGPGAVE